MKIAFIGTRGIPNHYGGFEQFVTYLAPALAQKNHEVYVYNSSLHPYKEKEWNGVKIISRFDPQNKIGMIGQFVYDLLCLLNARKKNFDFIFQLGYTSSSVWSFLFPKHAIIATSLDGMEWKRSKYAWPVKKFLQRAEKWAVKYSDILIADAPAIQYYLKKKYSREAMYIAYGAVPFDEPDPTVLLRYRLIAFRYNLIIARLAPENNIELIIKAYLRADINAPLVIVGGTKNKHGKYLRKKYEQQNIVFQDAIYDDNILNNLRYYSNIYFHGHSVGGTNPSLLEAMAAQCFILSHDNIFNRDVLEENAYYFYDERELALLLKRNLHKSEQMVFVENNKQKIADYYSWENIIESVNNCIMNAPHHTPQNKIMI